MKTRWEKIEPWLYWVCGIGLALMYGYASGHRYG